MDDRDNNDQRAAAKATEKQSAGKKHDLHRLASLIADGQVPFPKDFPAANREKLARLVSQFRRRRLLKFIACAIAQDIHRSGDTKHKEL